MKVINVDSNRVISRICITAASPNCQTVMLPITLSDLESHFTYRNLTAVNVTRENIMITIGTRAPFARFIKDHSTILPRYLFEQCHNDQFATATYHIVTIAHTCEEINATSHSGAGKRQRRHRSRRYF